MTSKTLPYDMARCKGRITSLPIGEITSVLVTSHVGHAECVRCRRREPGRPDGPQVAITPPTFEQGKCPQRIAP